MDAPEEQESQETIGQRLRRLRLERGLSQRDISSRGVSYAYVSRIEAGQREPSLRALRLLARKLRVPPSHLETGEPISPEYDRQVRISDAELALRLERDEEQAVDTFRSLLKEAHEEADDDVALRAAIGLGLALARAGKYREAIAHLEKAKGTVTPLSRPDVYSTLGYCYAAAGERHRSIALFEGVLSELPADDLGLHVRFASYLSCALADDGELEQARTVLMELAARAEQDMDAQGRVLLYWSMSRVEKLEGEVVAAMALARRAMGLMDAYDDTREVARGHLLCAEILLSNDDSAAQATFHLERAERLFELGADHRDLGSLRIQQAIQAVLFEKADEAEAFAREALDYLTEHTLFQGSAWFALGRAQVLKHELDGAVESFQKAAELLDRSGEWREATRVYRHWARALRLAGREKEALDVMEQATLVTVRGIGAETRASRE